jgi:catechol 2,3-dioxygenase-like lactoylglutathione lyase family enzyme
LTAADADRRRQRIADAVALVFSALRAKNNTVFTVRTARSRQSECGVSSVDPSRTSVVKVMPSARESLDRQAEQKQQPTKPSAPSVKRLRTAATKMHTALVDGDEATARTLARTVVGEGTSVADLTEQVISPSLRQISQAWHDGQLSIWVEHRASATTEPILGDVAPNPRAVGEAAPSWQLSPVIGTPSQRPWLPSRFAGTTGTFITMGPICRRVKSSAGLDVRSAILCKKRRRPLADASCTPTVGVMHIDLLTVIVDDYDEAIAFFTDALGFELTEDSPSLTNDGQPKRWVVVRPPGDEPGTGLLLAQADGGQQEAEVGQQFAGRVGLFLRVDDFTTSYESMRRLGVEFMEAPRHEAYGTVVMFKDIAGNLWDLLGPTPTPPTD